MGGSRWRRRSRAEADEVGAEYAASGLIEPAFSGQRDIPLKTLARYVTRYRKQKACGTEWRRWVAVEFVGQERAGGDLAVLVSRGRGFEVKRAFNAGTLRQLVSVPEQA